MPFDPTRPESIFEGNNLFDFACGLSNAATLRLGTGGDPFRHDVGVCMKALGDANAELKRRPTLSTDCRYNDHEACEGSEPAIWPDGDQTTRKCSCACHEKLGSVSRG